ncbi:hypothetical protein HanPSC8_Chr14g0596231 [Helianthus annuus]|nr:hypothetical protein HanPSC8_Chr14g0596231 [Helianthus annuus]
MFATQNQTMIMNHFQYPFLAVLLTAVFFSIDDLSKLIANGGFLFSLQLLLNEYLCAVAVTAATCPLSINGVAIFLPLSNFLTSVDLFADSILTPRYCLPGVVFSVSNSPLFLFNLSFLLAEYSS